MMGRKAQGMTDGELYELLGIVNIIRQALRLKPIQEIKKGMPDSSNYCPLANSFGQKISVRGAEIDFYDIGSRVDMDTAVQRAKKVAEALHKVGIKTTWAEGREGFEIRGHAGTLIDKFVSEFDAIGTRLARMFSDEAEEEVVEEELV